MDIKTYNKALTQYCRKGLNFSFIKPIDPTDVEQFFCNDTDTVRYRVIAKKDLLTLYFYFVDLEKVWSYIQPYFRKVYYQNFSVKVIKSNAEPSLQISITMQGFTILSKSFTNPRQSGVQTGKNQFDPLIDALSKKLGSIKRHFLSSPFEIMLEIIKANASDKGNRTAPNLSFYLKAEKKQKVWLGFEKNQITIYYGLNFQDRFEQHLAKIYFSELIDSKKHVHNAPAVSVSEFLPRNLVESFPEEKSQKYSFTTGIVSLTIFNNVINNHRTMATNLANFRNYSYYHIQAWKCYLHSRVLRRIQFILKDLSLAQIQGFAKN